MRGQVFNSSKVTDTQDWNKAGEEHAEVHAVGALATRYGWRP
jgi:pyrimidine deaminase RibD-like protein